MTDIPKAPDGQGAESDELFELEDADFQPVEPTGKFKLAKDAAAPTPVSTDTIQIVTGEIETTPTPQLAPTAPAPIDAGRSSKGARQALQDALLQLQKNKHNGMLSNEPSGAGPAPKRTLAPLPPRPGTAAAPPAAGAPPAAAAPLSTSAPPAAAPFARSAHDLPGEDLTPLPGPAPTAAPWQAAITSEVALMPETPDARPPDAEAPPEAEVTAGRFQSPSAGHTPSPDVGRVPSAEISRTPTAGAARVPKRGTSTDPAVPIAPRPSLQEQARLAKGGLPTPTLPEPPRAFAPGELRDQEPAIAARLAPQEMPFQKPLLTPLAGGPEADTKVLSQTTEVMINEAITGAAAPAAASDVASIGAPTPPTWALEAPPEEAPSMMDLLPPDQQRPELGHTMPPQEMQTSGSEGLGIGDVPEPPAPGPMDMGPEQTADGPSPALGMNVLTRDADSAFTARSATSPLDVVEPRRRPSPKARFKRATPLIVGLLGLLAVAAVLVVRHRTVRPPPQPVAQVQPPPAKPAHEPHKEKVHAPKPVLPAVTEPLTADNVDRLGYHALAAGVESLGANAHADAGLLMWARLRLANRFDDAAAKAALGHALDDLPVRGRIDASAPLLTAAQASVAIQAGRWPLARRLIIALVKSPAAAHWQTLYTQALWQSRRVAPAKLLPLLDRILRAAPNNADVRLWRAEIMLRRNVTEGVRVMTDLARHKDPDTIARIAQLLERPNLMHALPAVLEPLDDGSTILQAAPAHQLELLRLYTASRLLHGDYEAPRTIAEALARGDGDAPAVTVWARLTQYEGDDPGSVLQQGIDAQSDKTVRGWLLYEAVRLALERHDTDHARFLADGMNSMPQADIGAFAPLAAARVELAGNQVKQAKRHLAAALAADAENRSVQVAEALDQSTPEVPIRWAGTSPIPPEILWQRAHAVALGGQGGIAARMAEELFWRDPTLLDPVVLLGAWSGWLDQAGEALHAESLLEGIVPALSDDDRPLIQLIKQARRGKRYDAAVLWYEVLMKRRPGDPELTVALAKTYIDAQKPDVAARMLSEAEHANPNVRTPVFMTTMAGALSKSDPTRARNLLAVALRVQPSADSYILLADMENAAGHPEEELRALQAALPLAPDDGPLHLRVATLLKDKRMSNQAMALLQPLTNDAEAMEMLGDLLQESGDLPDAMTAYQRADTAYQHGDGERTGQAGLLVKIGVLQLNDLHNAPAAIKTLQKAVSVAPRHGETFYWLSRAFAHSGMRGVAKKLLGKYLRLAPDGPHADEARRELASGRRGVAVPAP